MELLIAGRNFTLIFELSAREIFYYDCHQFEFILNMPKLLTSQ